jgi:hypothetical protein
MKPAHPLPEAPRETATFGACLAALLELPVESVPAPADHPWECWRDELAKRGVGLVRLPAGQRWPAYWIALLDSADGVLDAVVMWDAECVFDPWEDVRQRGAIREAVVLGLLDPARESANALAATGDGVVEAIYIARDVSGPMVAVPSAGAIAGVGLDGDRYARGEGTFARAGRTGQALTLVDADLLEEAGVLSAAESRRNVVTRGIDLNALVGKEFWVGEVRCFGQRLCEPCSHLQRLTRPGILRSLVHRSGLRADILDDGVIQLGDRVHAA